jgi:Mrp family chromosome partitioning ATPase
MTGWSQDGAAGPLESSAYEAIRALKEGLGIVPAGNRGGRILLITSTARGEGRTTTAIALARFLSEDGLRVLMIDADFQHPNLAAALGLRLALGFSDLLTGRAAYKNAIVRDPASRAHVLGTGRSDPMAALASPRLHTILSELNQAYDVIILDAAPIWSAEVRLLSPLAEQCVYAVRWGTTEKNRATEGVRHLADSGLRGGIGLVLTCANQAMVS